MERVQTLTTDSTQVKVDAIVNPAKFVIHTIGSI